MFYILLFVYVIILMVFELLPIPISFLRLIIFNILLYILTFDILKPNS